MNLFDEVKILIEKLLQLSETQQIDLLLLIEKDQLACFILEKIFDKTIINCLEDDKQFNNDVIKKIDLNLITNKSKYLLMEIRPGVGGSEANIFALDLMNMYLKCANNNNIKYKINNLISSSKTGIRSASISFFCKNINNNAFLFFNSEGGTHRVQRVPLTENKNRVHTSTATVAILDDKRDIKFEVKTSDMHFDFYRASGKGGQHVNKTSSAVRATHIPTKLVASVQDERSQTLNKDKAIKILVERVQKFYQDQLLEKINSNRDKQVLECDRSNKIRTYNFNSNFIKDHRLNISFYKIPLFMEGEFLKIINLRLLIYTKITTTIKLNYLKLINK